MERPVTSKARGICRYYTTPRGCFAGDSCKFLHGADERFTPYDKTKVCRYYAKGHCTRGNQCWFRHVIPTAAPDDERIQFNSESCSICLEKPTTYGLLTDCSHVYCLECIRQWREPTGKSPDLISSGMIKCCPLCRSPSRFVTPCEHFFPNGSPRKKDAIDAYKASMARVPCKYFEEASRLGKPWCPFGLDCFYKHTNPDGTPHVFRYGAKQSMKIYRRHRLRGVLPPARFDYDDPIEFLQHIFENPNSNLHVTLDVIRASLPAFMERFVSGNGLESQGWSEDEEIMDESIDPLELLADNLVLSDEAATTLSNAAREDNLQSTPMETLPEHAPSQEWTSLSSEDYVVSQPVTTPSISSQLQPSRYPSRFSTVLDTQNRQTFIIDISDDDDDDEDEGGESARHVFDTGPNSLVESFGSPHLASTPVTQSSPERRPASLQPVDGLHTDMLLRQPQREHDVDPPFVTDGRGRVVWSSTRNVSGRGAVTDSRAPEPRHSGPIPRVAFPSASSTHLFSNGRSHAWGGHDTQSVDRKGSGGEGSSDLD